MIATHPWNLDPAQARELQRELARRVVLRDGLGEVQRVAGVDVGFEDGGATVRGAIAVLDADTLEPLEETVARRATTFPYIPGLLSFRELPAILDALDALRRPPDLVLCDGQGTAHPRRFGIACHLGVLTGLPTIGVAKSRLCGEHGPVPQDKGAWVPLRDGNEIIGGVVRTRAGVRPLYVSPGHRVSLATAVAWTLRCTTRYRLPETTRRADRIASRRFASHLASGGA
ncbi:MAG: deoxyribonuclease V [Ectothiorhodospiraceae bacterium]|nr:deoxyribonuclease V [Ectothiorhodospiraceae bacterium]